jgi:xylulokinase
MNCTVATENVARAFGFDSRDGDAVLGGTRPGADGLGMLPFFNGERTPDLPRARASFHGLDFSNFTRANAYRAAMEGATYALRGGFDSLRAAGLDFSSIRLTGGGSRSTAWRQMVADVFELPVEVPVEQEGAAFGAALQALWACTTSGTQPELSKLANEYVLLSAALGTQPDPAASAAYRSSYERFLHQLQIEIDRSGHPHSI